MSVDRIEGVGPKRFTKSGKTDSDQVFRKARITLSYEDPTYGIKSDEVTIALLRSFPPNSYSPNVSGAATSVNWPYEYGMHRNVTKIIQPIAEAIRLPVGFYQWAEKFYNSSTGINITAQNAVAATGSYVKLQTFAEITYIWHRVPASLPILNNGQYKNSLCAPAVFGVGTVNAYEFDGYPPGTLLLTSVNAQPYKWVTGELYYDYTFKMKLFYAQDGLNLAKRASNKPIGHNYFLRFATTSTGGRIEPSYCLITHDGTLTGQPIFRRFNYMYLFSPISFDYANSLSVPLFVDEITKN
jgi:hypothetical protein